MKKKQKRTITKMTKKCITKVNLRSQPHVQQSQGSIFKSPLLAPDFYQVDALALAPRLLGKHLKKDDVILQITEVEAYRPNDSACHGRFGITARTAPVVNAASSSIFSHWEKRFLVFELKSDYSLKENQARAVSGLWSCLSTRLLNFSSQQFGAGGHAYIYLCYGLHNMLNVVADKEGNGAAVLVRSCAPVHGLETIQRRRGLITEKPVLLTGPGKVGQALGISTNWSSHPLFTPGGLELLDGPDPENIVVGPRVGIDYALPEHVSAPWRFAIAGSQWISSPKNNLRPMVMEEKGGDPF